MAVSLQAIRFIDVYLNDSVYQLWNLDARLSRSKINIVMQVGRSTFGWQEMRVLWDLIT